jgi:phage-related protein
MKLRGVRLATWEIYAACSARGDSRLLDFLATTDPEDDNEQGDDQRRKRKKTDPIQKDKRRMLTLLNWVAESGPPRNAEISHRIGDDIWQFSQGRVRVPWFYGGRREIILSHGFIKKTQRTPAAEIERAAETLRSYRKSLKDGVIERSED